MSKPPAVQWGRVVDAISGFAVAEKFTYQMALNYAGALGLRAELPREV
jgi:hypothetical protein